MILFVAMLGAGTAHAGTRTAACVADACFTNSVSECVRTAPLRRQPTALGFRLTTKHCRQRLIRQCRRYGVQVLTCPVVADDSPGGAFPSTTTTTMPGSGPTTTTLGLPFPPVTTTTLPPFGGAFVGKYQFYGTVTYAECSPFYPGATIP